MENFIHKANIKANKLWLFCQPTFKTVLFGWFISMTLETHISLAIPAAKLNEWHFNPKTQQLEINLSAETIPQYFYLAQPPRLVIDLPNTQLGRVATSEKYEGTVQSIRVAQSNPIALHTPEAIATRIVLDLAPGTFVDPKNIQIQSIPENNRKRWILSPVISHHRPAAKTTANTSAVDLSAKSFITLPPILTNLPQNNQQPFVIVPPINPALTNNSTIPNVPIIEFGQPLP